jgi:hypothetical protein
MKLAGQRQGNQMRNRGNPYEGELAENDVKGDGQSVMER